MLLRTGIPSALIAALLFGASVPLAKLLVGQTEPLMLAALLYLGSGLGLGAWMVLRRLVRSGRTDSTEPPPAGLARSDLPWLAGAVVAGGMLGPVLLMTGLRATQASTASLLLNLEAVLTAVIAWFVFREPFDRRIFTGMILIVTGGLLLAWPSGPLAMLATSGADPAGPLLIALACLCWAADNNFTRRVAANDATLIAAVKGLAAGSVNLLLALWMDLPLPPAKEIAAAGAVGMAGYGVSLVLFVLALRHLGTARTGAYFAIAPFVGAALSLLLPGEIPGVAFWAAALLMAAGVWLHLSEVHSHLHTHETQQHAHRHRHDAHHRHEHDFPWDGSEPHTHPHRHEAITHAHPHFPDIHHRHQHK